MMRNPQSPWMSVSQLAAWFDVDRSTIYRLRGMHGFPQPIYIGSMPRYRLEEVEAFFAKAQRHISTL
nr:helix-turn-helix domain-containing protein [Maliibacterium massiliense]